MKQVLSAVFHSKERNEVIQIEQTQIYNDSFYKKFTTTQKVTNSNVIFPLIEKYIEIKRVVDIGCGVGAWSKYFFEKGVYVKGYDFDWVPDEYMAVAGFDWLRPDKRTEYMRARIETNDEGLRVANVYPSRSSGVLSSVTWADGMVVINPEQKLMKGDSVRFIPFSSLY